jgi:hypothetical protein
MGDNGMGTSRYVEFTQEEIDNAVVMGELKQVAESTAMMLEALAFSDSAYREQVYQARYGTPHTATGHTGHNVGQFAKKVAKNRARNKAARKARRK